MIGYTGRLQGQPGPQHVALNQRPASLPNPSGNGEGCPLTDFTGRRRNDSPISQSEIAYRKNRRHTERVRSNRERAKLGGK